MLKHPHALKKAHRVKASLATPSPKKDIFLYNVSGSSNQTDKIVVRFALTIYPYSLGTV